MLLEVSNVKYAYQRNIPVLRNASFDLNAGEIIGLVGPNGSGKTTLIKLIVDLLAMRHGEVRIDGASVGSSHSKMNSVYLASNEHLPEFLSGSELLRLMHSLYGKKFDSNEIARWFERYQMAGRQHDLIEDYSHGMRKKTQLIAALMLRRGLALIDETLNGVDIDAVYLFEKDVRELANEGAGVLLCSHDLRLLERVSDRVIFLLEGELVETGATADLVQEYGSLDEMIRFYLEGSE